MKKILGILTAFVMLLTCCVSGVTAETAAPEAAETTLALNGQEATVRTNSEGKVTFIGGSCTDAPVRSAEDAAAVTG